MSRRKDAKALARWDNEARQWATATGRDLALDLYYDRETAIRPYGVGVVLDPGEKVWAEVPVSFNFDWPPLNMPSEHAQPSVRTWLVTSARVVGRLADDRLHGYRWEMAVGARVDLTPGREVVSLDIDREPTLIWTGPAVAPLAVAAVFHLYGAVAMIDHPGLSPLRVLIDASKSTDRNKSTIWWDKSDVATGTSDPTNATPPKTLFGNDDQFIGQTSCARVQSTRSVAHGNRLGCKRADLAHDTRRHER
jgi:hypothetical protein